VARWRHTSVTNLSDEAIARLDAYQLLASLGKRIVHPGGKRSTEDLFALASIGSGHNVLEVGCGPGTTAVAIAERFGAQVTAVDIDDMMLDQARATVAAKGLSDRVLVEKQDIQHLQFPDDTFDRVIIEAVTMFVDLAAASREVVRVCKPGGVVVDHEFIWRKRPTPRIREAFQMEVCRMTFEDAQMWEGLYRRAGLDNITTIAGDFVMMTPRGFVRDEGIRNTLRIAGRALRRRAFIRRTIWNLRRIIPAVPYLGWVVVSGTKSPIVRGDTMVRTTQEVAA
jgi:ubiquinone/menaquinone biosynthesis C-methylase UbiE